MEGHTAEQDGRVSAVQGGQEEEDFEVRGRRCRFAKESLSSTPQAMGSRPLKVPLMEMERMPTMPTLPPDWVDQYEECVDCLQEVYELSNTCLTQRRRS